jgi:hypothetical protein
MGLELCQLQPFAHSASSILTSATRLVSFTYIMNLVITLDKKIRFPLDVGSIMDVTKLDTFRDSVSWTSTAIFLFLHTINRAKVNTNLK